MASDIDIAQAAKLKRITAIAAERLGIDDEHLEPYGHYKAKLSLDYVDSLKDKPDGRLMEADAQLKDLKIEGDQATAKFVQTRGGKESSGPIAFQKKDGDWKISKVPPLMK